jgi:hypothetical protein
MRYDDRRMVYVNRGPSVWAFPTAPHLLHASDALACWFTEPPGVLLQITAPVDGTASMVAWMAGEVHEALLSRYPIGDLTIILDLRLMTGREPSARHGLVEPAKRLKARAARTILLPPRNASRLYLGSMYAATALLSAVGIHVEIAQSMTKVVTTHRLRPAPR